MKNKKILIVLFLFLIVLNTAFQIEISANAAEPPSLVIITKTSDDVEIYLVSPNGNKEMLFRKLNKKIEDYHILYNKDLKGNLNDLENAKIKIKTDTEEFYIENEVVLNKYNTVYRLDKMNKTLVEGKGLKRSITLIASRITITIIIEMIIFYMFGFREKRSYYIFLLVNLVTQFFLNYNINNMLPTTSYLMLNIIFMEIIILITELITLNLLIKEKNKIRISLFVIVANFLSYLVGGYIIMNLPI